MQSCAAVPTVASRPSTVEFQNKAIARVIEAMREQLSEPLSLDDLAEIAVMSPYHFDRMFRQIVGIPPCQFLGALRIQEAKRLLLTTQMSVTDVCFEVGYNSLGTFITRFTQLVGLPPRRLRHLAEVLSTVNLQSLCEDGGERAQANSGRAGLYGEVGAPDAFEGLILIGAFPAAIPNCRPADCVILAAPGHFSLSSVPDGKYHVLAAGVSWSEDPVSFLLADDKTTQVGRSSGSLDVRNQRAQDYLEICLRPMQFTDPPILFSLPYLLTEFLTARELFGDRELFADPALDNEPVY
jgi:AraC family transcriptional regulator